MPIPMVLTSSDGFTGSMKYSRFGGPVFSGTVADGGSSGPLPAPGAVALIQSTAALVNQVISTGAPARGSYIYIPVSTNSMVSSANSAAAPPYAGFGAALVWNDADKRLEVYSSGSSGWLSLSTAGGFTSS